MDQSEHLTTTNPELIIDGSDREFRNLVYGLLTMSAGFEQLREHIASLIGLSGIQYHVLMAVTELEAGQQPVNVTLVADTLRKSGAYVTVETGKLMRLGLLTKTPNPDDGRGVLLKVTPEGRRAIEEVAPHLRRINDLLFEGVDGDTFFAFRRIVDLMTDNTEQALVLADWIAKEKARLADRAKKAVRS